MDNLSSQDLTASKEMYPDNWHHAMIHLNPDTGEIHCEGEQGYFVRQWLLQHIALEEKRKPTIDYLDTLLAKKEPQSHREHILEAITVKLNLPLPESDGQYKVWEKALDSIVVECRSHANKKRLDAALTKDIVAAIRAAKSEKGGYPFETADQPHTGVVARIVKAFRNREWVAPGPYEHVRPL